MKAIFFSTTLILISLSVNAQISNISLGGSAQVLREKEYTDVIGTPYLTKNWMSGVLYDKEGNEYSNIMLRYDMYKERVEYLIEGKTYEINNGTYPRFSLNVLDEETNRVETLDFNLTSSLPGMKTQVFVNYLHKGTYVFVRKPLILLLDENLTSYGTSQRVRRFQRDDLYFLKKDGEFKQIKLNKKSILAAFPDLDQYLKTRKVKDSYDLVEVLQLAEQKPN
jgi:hypothetical protein